MTKPTEPKDEPRRTEQFYATCNEIDHALTAYGMPWVGQKLLEVVAEWHLAKMREAKEARSPAWEMAANEETTELKVFNPDGTVAVSLIKRNDQ